MNVGSKTPTYWALVAISIFTAACATVVNPTGGLTDRLAPRRISCAPSDTSVNFVSKKIVMEFDEFIKTNNPNSQIIMNPFAGELPQIDAQGKKLIIKLPDSLLPNTTYTISFGGAVSDITEGNKALDLKYVFSTGSRIDSFAVSGVLTDAFSREPISEAWVFLHRNENGILTSKPDYLVRSREDGRFFFSNLSKGSYFIYALKDANTNYLFDQPNELVAFSDSAISLNENIVSVDSLQLLMFQEADTIQKRIKTMLMRNMVLQMVYRIPLSDPTIEAQGNTPPFVYLLNTKKDSITFWFQNSAEDSASVILTDGLFRDTITTGIIMGQKSRNTSASVVKMEIRNNIHASLLDHFSPLTLTFNDPVISANGNNAQIINEGDSLTPAITRCDSIGRIWCVSAKLSPNTPYIFTALPGTFTDMYGRQNDSLRYEFTTTDERDFGELTVSLTGELEHPMIFDLLSANGALVASLQLNSGDQLVSLPLIRPGEYSLRLIIDSNGNGKWDTGNLLEKTQPEKVIILPARVYMKANWTNDIKWDITY